MKSRKIFLSVLLIMTLAMTGCGMYSGSKGGRTKYQDVKTEVTEFSVTFSSDTAPITYSLSKDESGIYFEKKQYDLEGEVTEISAETYEKYNDWIDDYDIRSWDGFHRVQKDVMDGSGFELLITLGTGETISAGGSNAFPKNFYDAKEALLKLFTER